jgi:hypothetical protein
MDLETATEDATPADIDNFMESAFDELEETGEIIDDSDISEEQIANVVEAKTDSDVAEDTDIDDADRAEVSSEPDNQTITAPQSMSAKDRETFTTLPPEQQKWISDRAKEQESAFTQKTMELAEQRKGYDKLDQILAPRRQQLALDGMDDSTAIGQLFALSDYANNDPIGFVKYMMNARQIPMSALTESAGPQQPADPQLAAMQQKMQGFENFLTQQQMQAQQQAETSINSDVQKFAQDNEFYAELENEMIPVVAALRQNDPSLSNHDALSKAYKMAIAANDGVSAKVEASKSTKAETDKVALAKARAAKSKKAAASNVVRSGARPAGKAGVENVEDFIGGLVDERMTA